LNPLRAFEVAARHLSFTHAADELSVTQGAISRSVKALEDYLGEPLFERTGHGLALTERSEALALKLSDAFMQLSQAADEFRGIQSSPVLRVRAYTSFLIGFLIPNLPRFQVNHPQIKVRLVPETDSAEFARDNTDVRIRYGRGHWKNVDSTLLFRDSLRPLCSRALLDPAKRPYPVEELRRHVLLHQELRQSDWPEWLSMVGSPELAPRDNLTFDELSVVYEAAIAGVGMVMAQRAYFQRETADGRLFEPFDPVLTRDLGYYLTTPANRRDWTHVRLFKRWLLEEIEKTGACNDEASSRMTLASRNPIVSAATSANSAAGARLVA
jgi:DNA-binding transcriptional LysR family regulator